VEVTVPTEETPEGTQLVSLRPGRRLLTSESRQSVGSVVTTAVHTVEGFRGVVVDEQDGVLVVEIYIDRTEPPAGAILDPYEAAEAVQQAIAADPAGMARVEIITRPRHRVLTRVTDVPGFGWARCRPDPLDVAPVEAVGRTGLGNGLVELEVDPTDGTWSLGGRPGYGRLVDDGDVGDTYNYCPPATDTVVDRPASVEVEVLEAGPLRGRITITATYAWPERTDAAQRHGARSVEVRTLLELRAGEDLVRVRHELDNPCTDHRLRVWFPLPEPATSSRAESVFGSVERGLTAEGGPNELGLPTFPMRRFVEAGGLTVATDGLLEYELVDIDEGAGTAGQLALTLLRCTGLISQGPMPYRPVPAGPQIETGDAQMPGRQVLEYAVATSGRNPYAIAEDAFLPLVRARTRSGVAGLAGLGTITPPIAPGAVDWIADRGSPLTVTGAEVSSVTRSDGRLSVRVFNPTGEEAVVSFDGRRGWLVDLRGRTLEPFEGSFGLHPHGIATAVLDD
jgi:alpha-mannosidase